MTRYCSYLKQNYDILTRLGWVSDPLLLWEKVYGQKLKPGHTALGSPYMIRNKKAKCVRQKLETAISAKNDVPYLKQICIFCPYLLGLSKGFSRIKTEEKN